MRPIADHLQGCWEFTLRADTEVKLVPRTLPQSDSLARLMERKTTRSRAPVTIPGTGATTRAGHGGGCQPVNLTQIMRQIRTIVRSKGTRFRADYAAVATSNLCF